jgi:hypothetical protein
MRQKDEHHLLEDVNVVIAPRISSSCFGIWGTRLRCDVRLRKVLRRSTSRHSWCRRAEAKLDRRIRKGKWCSFHRSVVVYAVLNF